MIEVCSGAQVVYNTNNELKIRGSPGVVNGKTSPGLVCPASEALATASTQQPQKLLPTMMMPMILVAALAQ